MMITNKKMMQSQLLRQNILDYCNKEIRLLTEIADAVGINKNKINHHLLCLVGEGYLIKHHGFTIVQRAVANGYSTARTPYVWTPNIMAEPIPKDKPQPFIVSDEVLMNKMGYTNLIPIKGRVHHGIVSAFADRQGINE